MTKSIEDCTHDELIARLQLLFVTYLFKGELAAFIRTAIEWSIRWWQAEEQRRIHRAKFYIPDGALIKESDLSPRAIRVLITEDFVCAKDIRDFIQKHNHAFQARAAINKFASCGPITTTEIMDYYLYTIDGVNE